MFGLNPRASGSAYRALGMMAVAGVLLTACSAGHELKLESAPSGAAPVRQFTPLTDGIDAPSVLAAGAVVQKALEVLGGGLSEQGWTLQTAVAVREADIGAFSDDYARNGRWDETPRVRAARRGDYLHLLSVVLSHPDGDAHRSVHVSGRSNSLEMSDELLNELAQVAAIALFEGEEAAQRKIAD